MARPKGSVNHVTKEVREMLRTFVAGEFKTLQERIENLKDWQRVEVLLKLLPYLLPRWTERGCNWGNEDEWKPKGERDTRIDWMNL